MQIDHVGILRLPILRFVDGTVLMRQINRKASRTSSNQRSRYMINHLSPPNWWNWRVPVVNQAGTRADRLVFVGGQGDLDSDGNVCHPGELRSQVVAAMDRMYGVIEYAGGRKRDLVKLLVFHTGKTLEDEQDLLRQIRSRIVGATPPVISLVSLPHLAYEGMTVVIDALAIDDADAEPSTQGRLDGPWPWQRDAEFSHGRRCGEFLLVGGQSARDGTGRICHGEDIVSQAQLTIENIARVLDSLGADLDDVVKLNTWYVGYGTDADWRRAAQIRSNAFRYPGPGATGVPVPNVYPDGALIRQECWALRAPGGGKLPRSLSWPHGHWDWPMRVSFQQAVKVGQWIFLGGQVALDPHGKTAAPGDMAAQTHINMEFVRNLLAGFGATMEDMVKLTCFYRTSGEQNGLHENLAIRSSYFGQLGPASTSVPLENLGFEGVMLEIEGIALMAQSSR
jgi:enamine deaminase RidA (YjgF/YER057c/UK114 family)